MKLGVFDSGIGGEAVAMALQKTFPDATIITINDRTHVPYGNKTQIEVIQLTDAAIQPFISGDYDVIILACNTATALAIEYLRITYPTQRFIGIEPMVKTATELTKTATIAVFATPATLASYRYKALVLEYATQVKILEPDCSKWAHMIENNTINRADIASIVTTVCDSGADVLVLGCTHYHWIKQLINDIAGESALVIEPSEAIGRRVIDLMQKR